MQRNDYKDALNELQLSEEFCREMEKKLSETVFDNDGYYDEVVHVDVIRKRSRKSFAAAAAAVLVLGICGTGTAYMFKDKLTTVFSNEDEEEIEDEIGLQNNDEEKYEYAFPFGNVDLRYVSFSFNYNTDHSSFPTTVSATADQADIIKEMFSDVEWELYEPDEDISELEYCKESISLNSVNGKYSVMFWADGNVAAYVGDYEYSGLFDDNYSVYYYMIPPEKYKELKNKMFGDLKFGHLESFGISASLEGARYSIYEKSGKLSSEQAYDISRIVNVETKWTLLGENADVPEEAPDISINFSSEDNRVELGIYGSQKLLVVTKKSNKGLMLKREIYEGDEDFRAPIEKLLCNSVACECPLDLGDADHALIEYYNGQKWSGYNIDREKLDGLLEDMRGMNWRNLYHVKWQKHIYDPDFEKVIIIKAGDAKAVIYSNGEMSYEKVISSDIYSVDGYDQIEKRITSFDDGAVNDSDLVNLLIDNIFDSQSISLLSGFGDTDKEKSKFTEEEIERFKEKLKDIEWEKLDVGDYGLGKSPIKADQYSKTFYLDVTQARYMLFSDNEILMLYDDGKMLCKLPKWGVKCKEPEKLYEIFDELMGES